MKRHTKIHNIESVKEGLERSLGEETAYLVLKTLKLVYKIDEEAIVSNPELFEEKIRKMLGHPLAEVVLKSISKA